MTIDETYHHLLQLVSSERFIKMQGLNNEVPFFICPYPCKDTIAFSKMVNLLTKNLEQKEIVVLTINLYDLCIEMLTDRGVLEQILKKEQQIAKDKLMELLTNVLDSEKHLAPKIANVLSDKEYDVLFLTGVGEVYPHLRTHNVLNNLHSTIKDHPTVIFFPGDYIHSNTGGSTLSLFSKLQTDKYYRAFNILKCKV